MKTEETNIRSFKPVKFICIGLIRVNGFEFISPIKVEVEEEMGQSYSIVKKKKVYLPKTLCIKRVAFRTVCANGEKDWWYINDPSDGQLIKVSKYGKKVFKNLIQNYQQ